jgi:hypothetical protein
MINTNDRLVLTVLTAEQHEQTCNYWYTVTSRAMSLTAFNSLQGLQLWLTERGLKLTEPLTEPGTFSYQHIEGAYIEESHLSNKELADWDNLNPVLVSRTLSNGDYVVAKITDDNGVRTVHTLNPNVKDRHTFDYRESHRMMN